MPSPERHWSLHLLPTRNVLAVVKVFCSCCVACLHLCAFVLWFVVGFVVWEGHACPTTPKASPELNQVVVCGGGLEGGVGF